MKPECPLIPMGAITGKPSKNVLTETLEAYRNVGITQFLIYARSGCELEYLSEEWFDICEHIIKEADRLGFTSIWLYDEFNWPSGTCAWRLPKEHPEFALYQLCAYPDGDDYQLVVRRNPRMTDLMNPEAVKTFVEMTHEQYAKRFAPYMGRLIKGIFTDEPDIAFFSYENQEDVLRLPYYPGLEDDYKALSGSDLYADIRSALKAKSMFFQGGCNRLFAEKFRKNFSEYISEWGKKYGVVLTGHLMNEFESANALTSNGHPLPVLSGFSLPGMDEIFTHKHIATIEWLTLGTLMHAAEKQGNRGGLAELFALGPSDLSLSQIARQIWLTACFGVSKYVTAVSALDHRGNLEKQEYFCPFTRTQPWFEAFRELGEEAACAAEVATQERDCRIAVRYPYEDRPLTALLKFLTEKQYSWKLIMPGETTDAEVILNCERYGIWEEKTGLRPCDICSLEHVLLDKMALRPVRVENTDGTLATDLFLRCFKNGKVIVIDFSGKDRHLFLSRSGIRSKFFLPAEGVCRFPGWQISLDRPNTMRAEFENGICRFTVQDTIPNLRLNIRNYGPEVALLLDGTAITATRECTALPQGFRELYQETDVLTLSEGEHELQWLGDGKECPYLPEAIFTGDFSAKEPKKLSYYRHDGVGLRGYVGKIIQSAMVEIPLDAVRISFHTENMVSELLVDGKSLGRRIHAPFTWMLPGGIQGKTVEIKMIRMTSCSQLFGKTIFARAQKHEWSFLTEYAPANRKIPAPFCEMIWS